jgi:hypothetical protein
MNNQPVKGKTVEKTTSGDTGFDNTMSKFVPKGKIKPLKKVAVLPLFTPLNLKITRLEILKKFQPESQPSEHQSAR